MSTTLNKLVAILACPLCTGRLDADSGGQRISCLSCRESFRVVNGIPCFVPEALEGFTEIPPEERQKFLAMKKVAYGEDSFVSRMYGHYHRYAAQKRSKAGGTLLTVDVGFGVGEHYPFITAQEVADGSFIGVDLDRFKLEHFAALHPEIAVLQASAFRLPFADRVVDTVQLLATLEHFSVADMGRLLDESLRILKPGGFLIACYPAEGGLLLKLCQKVMHAYLKGRSGFDLDKGAVHRHLTGAAEIRSVLGGRRELERVETSFYPFGIRTVDLSLFVNELYRKR